MTLIRSKRYTRLASGLMAGASLLAYASSSRAQDDGARPAAMALFDEGRELVAAGKAAEACPKFEAAAALVQSSGILLNWADCLERIGRSASAWAEFREAQAEAMRTGREPEEREARRRLALLEPRLSKLTILVPAERRVAGLSIERDGSAVAPAAWDKAVPVDPGPHTIEVGAPQKERWTTSVLVTGEGKTITLELPELLDAPTPPASPPIAAPPLNAPPSNGESTSASSRESARRAGPPPTRPVQATAGWVVAGAGLVGIGVGAGFGISAKLAWNRARSLCAERNVCDASEAKREGTISTVAFSLGAAGLIAGSILILTAPGTASSKSTSTDSARVWISPSTFGGVGLVSGGEF